MNEGSLHLWFAYPGDLQNAEIAQTCSALLTDEERVRWQRYKFEQHRREYLATRALLRTTLSNYRSTTPAAWRFNQNEFGKPFIEPACGLRFNLSNSHELVACLISDAVEVGVDVESFGRSTAILEVAGRVFSPSEKAQLNELDEAARHERVLTLWTLKEAYIKARGMGLSLPLDKISFLFDALKGIRLKIDAEVDHDPNRWRFCSLDFADHRVSAVVEMRSTPKMKMLETRDLLAKPFDLGEFAGLWFPLA